MTIIRTVNLAIRFLLELSLLGVFGYWGVGTGQTTLMRILLGIGVPALTAAIWGRYLAPASASRLRAPWLLMVELLLFGSAIVALYSRGQEPWAWALGLGYLINRILLSVWRQ